MYRPYVATSFVDNELLAVRILTSEALDNSPAERPRGPGDEYFSGALQLFDDIVYPLWEFDSIDRNQASGR